MARGREIEANEIPSDSIIWDIVEESIQYEDPAVAVTEYNDDRGSEEGSS
jgi:hypothetical protein